jgi:DNA-binding SARP family transcriptional activator/class 3 adenylate cyclase
MEFRVLGPLQVLDGRRDVTPRRAKQRVLLGVLLVHANEPVSSEVLIDALWGERPPHTAQTALHGHVSALRKMLGAGRIATRARGYLACLDETEIDAGRFEVLVADARATDDPAARSRLLGEALALWRGEPLADFRYEDFAQGEIVRLEERRLAALEDQAEAELALGRHKELLPELEWLVSEQPLRERPRELLMLALYRAGRHSEALRAYEDGRRLLAEELGLDPGPALRSLQQRILEHDSLLEPPPTRPSSAQFPHTERLGVEERKLITVMSAEFLLGRPGLDPEAVRAALTPLRERVQAELERFGATVDRFGGGAVVALFGMPVAHEDDPPRAVTAALRSMELADQFRGDWPQLELAVRVGIATGEALIAPGSGPADPEGRAHGEVLALAVALQQAADADSVVIDELTARSSLRDIDLEELVPLRLEGEAGTRPVWRARAARPEPISRPKRTRLIGREHELALLETIRARVNEERTPKLVSIMGEAGIGKTRLTDELIGRIERDTVVYRGRCLPYGEGITYWPLREVLWAAARILLDEPIEAAEAKLRVLVAGLIPDRATAERTVAALARTAGFAMPDDPLAGMTPDSVGEEVGLAWPRFLKALASERPIVVVIEDLHWAEAPLVDILERIVIRSAGPLLILTAARPEFAETRPSWSSAPGLVQLGLERLTDVQTRELVGQLLPGASEKLRNLVAGPAEGNPFFAEELAHHAAEEAWTAAAPELGAAIPNTVRALLAARIDALPEGEKRTLQDAAVVGRTFWATTLESIGDAAAVRTALRALEEKGFIVASTSSVLPGQREFSFRPCAETRGRLPLDSTRSTLSRSRGNR